MSGKDFWNRLWNSFWVIARVPWSAINGVIDTISAPLYWALNFWERMGTRSDQIKEAIKNATSTWPNWKRWIRRPLAVTSWAVSYLTWGVRALLASGRDAIWGIFQAVWNTFNNVWSSILRMGEEKPTKDFSFAKLQPEKTPMNSVLPKRFKPIP